MELRFLNTSIGVAARDHNPTVLHPAFLASQQIVNDVELLEPPICTPAFAVVKYANGLAFIVEREKFQLSDGRLREDFSSSDIPRLAIKYLKTLPHVRYTGVGVNITAFVECASPEIFLITRFLKPGEWNDEALAMRDLGLNFVYEVPQAVLRLSCSAGTVRHEEIGEQRGILLAANYHTDLPELETIKEAEGVLALYPERCAHFAKTAKRILGLSE
jgi:hypothetical protein